LLQNQGSKDFKVILWQFGMILYEVASGSENQMIPEEKIILSTAMASDSFELKQSSALDDMDPFHLN
jgi:hypothetical protein